MWYLTKFVKYSAEEIVDSIIHPSAVTRVGKRSNQLI
jgi:hypothetical protein